MTIAGLPGADTATKLKLFHLASGKFPDAFFVGTGRLILKITVPGIFFLHFFETPGRIGKSLTRGFDLTAQF